MFRLREPYVPQIVSARPRRVATGALVGGTRVGSSAASIADELSGLKTTDDVDAVYRRHLKAGDVPSYIATDYWLTVDASGPGHTLELLTPSDYGAVGSAGDPFRIGKSSEAFAQEYADRYDAILPSQKLVRIIEAAADPKLGFIAVQTASGGADDSVDAVVRANDKANAAMSKAGVSPTDGKILFGYRKSYVVRPNLDGTYLAIYGGRWSAAGGLVQPTSGHAHTEGYSDYSHGLMLVSRKAKLDGKDVDLIHDVFLSDDPSIVSLVSDEGRFNPIFPNVGTGETTSYDTFGRTPGGGGGGSTAPTYTVDATVASVQRGLMDLGYDVGSADADGKLGPDTSASISKFRTEHGLPDGEVDQQLADAINSALAARAGASASGGYATIGAVAVALVAAIAAVWYFA